MIKVEDIKFGLNTFGDLAIDDKTNEVLSYEESLRLVVEEGVLADKLGVDVFALGEHHRKEYAISAPDTVLAALSTVTKDITLGTAVTVLSSDDPVRVYQRFATLDALSNGRAQVMLGRGSFTESFPLFGYDLKDYNELFEEKMALFNELLKNEPLTWKGTHTQSIDNLQVYPKLNKKLDTMVGVGGTPDSIIRAARYGLPVMLAIIGGEPTRFKPYIDLYKEATAHFGTENQPLGMHSHGIIAESDEEAKEIAWNYIVRAMDQIGVERGWSKMTRQRFDYEIEKGSYYVGSPETVAKKIAKVIREVGVNRFDLIYGIGIQPTKYRNQTIRLYGEVVIPRVKEILRNQENA